MGWAAGGVVLGACATAEGVAGEGGGRGVWGGGAGARCVVDSPDHAVFVEGVLIPAKCLVNGTTIAQVPVERVTATCHVELAEHDVLLAGGAAGGELSGYAWDGV